MSTDLLQQLKITLAEFIKYTYDMFVMSEEQSIKDGVKYVIRPTIKLKLLQAMLLTISAQRIQKYYESLFSNQSELDADTDTDRNLLCDGAYIYPFLSRHDRKVISDEWQRIFARVQNNSMFSEFIYTLRICSKELIDSQSTN